MDKFKLYICLIFVLLIASFSAAVSAFSDNHSSLKSCLTDGYEVGFGYFLLGKIFDYETGFGMVSVDVKGTSERIGVKVSDNTEFIGKILHFRVNSSFAGAHVGDSDSSVKLFSVKTLFPSKQKISPHNFKFGIQYKFLNNSTVSKIHFADLFAMTSLGTVNAVGGITSYFGNDIDTRLGGFINMDYPVGESLNLFAEYNMLDHTKTIQNNILARVAQNIGAINTEDSPRDAFSMGFKLLMDKKIMVKFTVYDVDVQMKPFIEASFLR